MKWEIIQTEQGNLVGQKNEILNYASLLKERIYTCLKIADSIKTDHIQLVQTQVTEAKRDCLDIHANHT